MTGERITSATIENRHAQAFPELSAHEIEVARRFGENARWADGQAVFAAGGRAPGLIVVLSGAIRIWGRDAHGVEGTIVEHGPAHFAGEVSQLTGARTFVNATAMGAVEALVVPPEQLRKLLIADAALGEKIVRAFTLRRVGLIESAAGGPVLMGDKRSPDVLRLRNFLRRNGVPHAVLDPQEDEHARGVVSNYAPGDLPIAVCNGDVLRNPTEPDLARCLGFFEGPRALRYDIAIVGAGPAGLSTAVYAASEGLSVVVIDCRAFGGQAGASARIENYFGFPTGITGQALTARAFVQAQKFGARVLIPTQVTSLACPDRSEEGMFVLGLSNGETIRSRTVVVASGARYRRPDAPCLREMEGRGVWYWASPVEASTCADEEVVLVGGGNSAGQGAVFLAAQARKVWMLVRAKGLAASMSSYLIDRIAATPNIELLTSTEIVDIGRSSANTLESVTWRNRETGENTTRPIRNVFLFLGAEPEAGWLEGCGVTVDAKGFVVTGAASAAPLESSVAGLFAVGDVRSGSVKRVGASIGEGAAAVAQIHAHLAQATTSA